MVAKNQRSTITYEDMVTQLKAHFDGGWNKTLINFEFHKISQKHGESLDAFVTRFKVEASKFDFSCAHNDYSVREILVRYQIIIGTASD